MISTHALCFCGESRYFDHLIFRFSILLAIHFYWTLQIGGIADCFQLNAQQLKILSGYWVNWRPPGTWPLIWIPSSSSNIIQSLHHSTPPDQLKWNEPTKEQCSTEYLYISYFSYHSSVFSSPNNQLQSRLIFQNNKKLKSWFSRLISSSLTGWPWFASPVGEAFFRYNLNHWRPVVQQSSQTGHLYGRSSACHRVPMDARHRNLTSRLPSSFIASVRNTRMNFRRVDLCLGTVPITPVL